jgi:hypothetical protein
MPGTIDDAVTTSVAAGFVTTRTTLSVTLATHTECTGNEPLKVVYVTTSRYSYFPANKRMALKANGRWL